MFILYLLMQFVYLVELCAYFKLSNVCLFPTQTYQNKVILLTSGGKRICT